MGYQHDRLKLVDTVLRDIDLLSDAFGHYQEICTNNKLISARREAEDSVYACYQALQQHFLSPQPPDDPVRTPGDDSHGDENEIIEEQIEEILESDDSETHVSDCFREPMEDATGIMSDVLEEVVTVMEPPAPVITPDDMISPAVDEEVIVLEETPPVLEDGMPVAASGEPIVSHQPIQEMDSTLPVATLTATALMETADPCLFLAQGDLAGAYWVARATPAQSVTPPLSSWLMEALIGAHLLCDLSMSSFHEAVVERMGEHMLTEEHTSCALLAVAASTLIAISPFETSYLPWMRLSTHIPELDAVQDALDQFAQNSTGLLLEHMQLGESDDDLHQPLLR